MVVRPGGKIRQVQVVRLLLQVSAKLVKTFDLQEQHDVTVESELRHATENVGNFTEKICLRPLQNNLFLVTIHVLYF